MIWNFAKSHQMPTRTGDPLRYTLTDCKPTCNTLLNPASPVPLLQVHPLWEQSQIPLIILEKSRFRRNQKVSVFEGDVCIIHLPSPNPIEASNPGAYLIYVALNASFPAWVRSVKQISHAPFTNRQPSLNLLGTFIPLWLFNRTSIFSAVLHSPSVLIYLIGFCFIHSFSVKPKLEVANNFDEFYTTGDNIRDNVSQGSGASDRIGFTLEPSRRKRGENERHDSVFSPPSKDPRKSYSRRSSGADKGELRQSWYLWFKSDFKQKPC